MPAHHDRGHDDDHGLIDDDDYYGKGCSSLKMGTFGNFQCHRAL